MPPGALGYTGRVFLTCRSKAEWRSRSCRQEELCLSHLVVLLGKIIVFVVCDFVVRESFKEG
jgi:hypothetical protein